MQSNFKFIHTFDKQLAEKKNSDSWTCTIDTKVNPIDASTNSKMYETGSKANDFERHTDSIPRCAQVNLQKGC